VDFYLNKYSLKYLVKGDVLLGLVGSILSQVSESSCSSSCSSALCLRTESTGKPWLFLCSRGTAPGGLAPRRFLRAALEPIEIILCFELTRLLSITTAPNSHRARWSSGHRADRFHKVPHALLTTVREGLFSWCSKT